MCNVQHSKTQQKHHHASVTTTHIPLYVLSLHQIIVCNDGGVTISTHGSIAVTCLVNAVALEQLGYQLVGCSHKS